jgi:hypothetical protein
MELSRFHAAIDQIASDYKANSIDTSLSSLVGHLASLGANPGNPAVSQAFKDQLDALRNTLNHSALNVADGDLLKTIEYHGLTKYVGNGLFESIKDVLDGNQLTPGLASTEIERFRVETVQKLNSVLSISSAFKDMGVEYWELSAEQTEILINLPMEQETKTLEDLAKEAKDWHQICRAIAETFDPQENRVTIRTVATGSVLLYLAAVPPFLFGIAKCLNAVNQVLAEVIKMKTLYKQLVESKVPDAVLKGFEDHNSGKAKTDLELLANTLVDEHYTGEDLGRRNELKNSLSISLQRLSRKLATGTKVSLRLAPPKRPIIEEGTVATPEQQTALEKIEQFERVQIEVNSSKASMDYREHANELMAALPGPIQEKVAE